jgi:uncharacterized protein (DUF1778 family)
VQSPLAEPLKSSESFSGRISFRTDERTHRKIVDAAVKAKAKSTNAWMEDVLSRAAKAVLGEDENSEIVSDSIQSLIQDPEASVELVRRLKPFLEIKDVYDGIRINAAIKKLLVGLDAVKPLLTDEDIQNLVANITPLLKEKDVNFISQLHEALKKLVIGLYAIQDFLIDQQKGSSDVLAEIEALLKK